MYVLGMRDLSVLWGFMLRLYNVWFYGLFALSCAGLVGFDGCDLVGVL